MVRRVIGDFKVIVRDESLIEVTLAPGDTVPEWAVAQLGPHVLSDDDDPADPSDSDGDSDGDSEPVPADDPNPEPVSEPTPEPATTGRSKTR